MLIQFNNGFYDISTKTLIEDTIEKPILTFKEPYIQYNNNDIEVQKINEIFESLFPNIDTRKYVLSFLSRCLYKTKNKYEFHTWIGNYDSQLFLLKLVESIFDNNFSKFDLELKRKHYGGPIKYKRLLLIECNENHNVGSYRKYEIELEQSKKIYICKITPKLSLSDYGINRRLHFVPFKELPNDIKQLDILKLNKAFIWILLNNIDNNAKISKEMKDLFDKNMNKYIFINEFLEDLDDNDKKSSWYLKLSNSNYNLTIEELSVSYDKYKIWYKEMYNINPPSKKDFFMLIKND